MSKSAKFLSVLLCIVLMMGIMLVSAQEENDPLFRWSRDSIWYSGGSKECTVITQDGNIYFDYIAPNDSPRSMYQFHSDLFGCFDDNTLEGATGADGLAFALELISAKKAKEDANEPQRLDIYLRIDTPSGFYQQAIYGVDIGSGVRQYKMPFKNFKAGEENPAFTDEIFKSSRGIELAVVTWHNYYMDIVDLKGAMSPIFAYKGTPDEIPLPSFAKRTTSAPTTVIFPKITTTATTTIPTTVAPTTVPPTTTKKAPQREQKIAYKVKGKKVNVSWKKSGAKYVVKFGYKKAKLNKSKTVYKNKITLKIPKGKTLYFKIKPKGGKFSKTYKVKR